jgi:hypothetical protein
LTEDFVEVQSESGSGPQWYRNLVEEVKAKKIDSAQLQV